MHANKRECRHSALGGHLTSDTEQHVPPLYCFLITAYTRSKQPSASNGEECIIATVLENKISIIKGMSTLLKKRPLCDLRTVDICAAAGVSRQTFYRCFDDKFAAALWFVEEGMRGSVRQIGVTLGWRTGYRYLFQFISRNRLFMRQIFKIRDGGPLGGSLVEQTLLDNCERHFKQQYTERTGLEPSDLIAFQIRAFSKTSTAILSEWQVTCKPDVTDSFLDGFVTLIPRELFDALEIPDDLDNQPLLFGM